MTTSSRSQALATHRNDAAAEAGLEAGLEAGREAGLDARSDAGEGGLDRGRTPHAPTVEPGGGGAGESVMSGAAPSATTGQTRTGGAAPPWGGQPASPPGDEPGSTGGAPWWVRDESSAPAEPLHPQSAEPRGTEPPPPPPAPPTPAEQGPPGGGRRWRSRAIGGVALVAVAVAAGTTGALIVDGRQRPSVVASAVSAVPAGGSTAPTEQLAQVAAAVQPSVVSVTVTGAGQTDEGSGVILRSDGTVLTNNHVVAAAAGGGSVTVKLADGRTAAADIVGRDPATDLAVVRAQGLAGLTPAALGSASSLHVGDTVLAVGSPLGLDGSVSSGIVSALHRTVNVGSGQQGPFGQGGGADPFGRSGPSQAQQPSATAVSDAIQTDAAINPGNSGGPLVDNTGHVVGIDTAIATLGGGLGGQSGSIGVGFAIPIDEARNVADQLMRGQHPAHAQLGVQVSDAPSGGALVGAVTATGAAAGAGLRAGDVITDVGGAKVTGADALTAAVRAHRPGDRVPVSYDRGGQSHTATVTLGSATG